MATRRRPVKREAARRSSSKPKSSRRRLNMDKARKKQEEIDSRSSSSFHEIKEGWNYFFVMPPWDDDVDVIWKEVQQHRFLVCPRHATEGKKDCMICTELRKTKSSEFSEQYALKSRGFFNAIRKADIKKKDPDTVGILALSSAIFREVIDYINDEDKDISDPEAAIPIGIHRRGKGLRTRYKIKFGEAVNISAYLTDKIMDALHNLDDMKAAQPASVKDMRKAIRGAADDDDDFEDDDLDGEEEIDSDEEFDGEDLAEEDDLLSEPEEEEPEEEEIEEEEEEYELEDDGEEPEEEAEEEEIEEEEDEFEPEEEEPPRRRKAKPAGRGRVRKNSRERPATKRRKVKRRRA